MGAQSQVRPRMCAGGGVHEGAWCVAFVVVGRRGMAVAGGRWTVVSWRWMGGGGVGGRGVMEPGRAKINGGGVCFYYLLLVQHYPQANSIRGETTRGFDDHEGCPSRARMNPSNRAISGAPAS